MDISIVETEDSLEIKNERLCDEEPSAVVKIEKGSELFIVSYLNDERQMDGDISTSVKMEPNNANEIICEEETRNTFGEIKIEPELMIESKCDFQDTSADGAYDPPDPLMLDYDANDDDNLNESDDRGGGDDRTDYEYATETEEENDYVDFETEEHSKLPKSKRRVYHELIIRLCQFCGTEFSTESAWRTHLDSVHQYSQLLSNAFEQTFDKSTLRCKICETELPCEPKSRKQQHFLNRQQHPVFLKCKLCDQVKYDSLGLIRGHIKDNHIAEIKQKSLNAIVRSKRLKNGCIYCGKLLLSYRALPYHYTTCHKQLDDEKIVFVCPSCGEEFPKEQLRKQHCAQVHQFPESCIISMELVESYPNSAKDKFQCLKCPKILKRRDKLHLFTHASTHMPHQLYKCRHCCERFTVKNKIRGHVCAGLEDAVMVQLPSVDHEKIATAQKKRDLLNLMFVCPICGEEFDEKTSWNAHLIAEHELDKQENLNIICLDNKNHKKCVICEQTWAKANKRVQMYHAFTHMPFKIKKCKLCKYESGGYNSKPCYCKRKAKAKTKPIAKCIKCHTAFEDGDQLKCRYCAELNLRRLEDLNFKVANEGVLTTYECLKCQGKEKFHLCSETLDYQKMSLHAKTHGKLTKYRCLHCRKSFESFSFFKRHEVSCVKQYTYIPAEFFAKYIKHLCPACGLRNSSVEMFREHIKNEHDFTSFTNLNIVEVPRLNYKLLDYKCTVCEHVFSVKFMKIFQNHAFTHMPFKLYNCAMCDLGVDTQLEIVDHLKAVHNVEHDTTLDKHVFNAAVIFHCPVCDIELQSCAAFTEHINNEHKLNTLEGLMLKKVVDKRANSNGRECYECLECRTKLQGGSRDRLEHRMLHLPHKPYECKICKYRFGWKTSVNRHIKTHNVQSQQEQNSSSDDKDDNVAALENSKSRTWTCKHCRGKYKSNKKLRFHVKNDHPNATFFCRICHKHFMQKQKLNRHFKQCHPGIELTEPTVKNELPQTDVEPKKRRLSSNESDDTENGNVKNKIPKK